MKYLFLLSVLFLFSCGDGSTSEAQVGDKTSMKFDRIVFDAGEVIKGEMITVKYVVTNTGDKPLVIGEVRGSCSCTVAEKPKNQIDPGKSETIVAYINTDKVNTGVLNKSIRVTANTEPSMTILKVKGVVRSK